jgi:glycosyltransferase involved in cell wall biosynthesis
VESYVADLCAGLHRHGHEVRVYTSDLAQHQRALRLPAAVPRRVNRGVRIRRLPALYLPGIAGHPLLPALPELLLRAPADIIHGHCFYYCTADFPAAVARLRRVPFVHNPYFYVIPTGKWAAYRRTVGRLTMRADVTVVISPFEQRLIEQSGFRVRRFEMVPPAVEAAVFAGARDDAFLARFGLDGRQHQIVLFVGRVSRAKGIDLLIAAARTVMRAAPEARFLIVGPDWGDRAEFERAVAAAGLRGMFVFTGALSTADLRRAYRSADLMAFPSRYEAFGIVMIEAMAAGLPVVATNASAIPCVVDHGATGLLFAPEDAGELAGHLVTLLRDPALRAQMGRTAVQHVAAEYSPAQQIHRLEAIYQSLI